MSETNKNGAATSGQIKKASLALDRAKESFKDNPNSALIPPDQTRRLNRIFEDLLIVLTNIVLILEQSKKEH